MELEEKVLELHKSGLSNRQIAISVSAKSHHFIKDILEKNGLKANGHSRSGKKLMIKDGKGKCIRCDIWLDLSHFRINRANGIYPYRIKYCNSCAWKARNKFLNNNFDAYIRSRFNGSKNRAKERGVKFHVNLDYIKKLYDLQGGMCAYTGEEMLISTGKGLLDKTLSFDRFDNSKGYEAGNILLCTRLINSVKNNLSLEMFSEYMPILYRKGFSIIERVRAEL